MKPPIAGRTESTIWAASSGERLPLLSREMPKALKHPMGGWARSYLDHGELRLDAPHQSSDTERRQNQRESSAAADTEEVPDRFTVRRQSVYAHAGIAGDSAIAGAGVGDL